MPFRLVAVLVPQESSWTLGPWWRLALAISFLVGPPPRLEGQTVETWSYQVQAGYAEINSPVATEAGGLILNFGLSRRILGRGLFRAGSDGSLSSADDGFASVSGHLEFRHSPAADFTLFAKMNWGYLTGSGYTGSFVAGSGGFLARVGARTWLLFGFSNGDFGERDGPNSVLIGLERGFGTPLGGNDSRTLGDAR